MSTFKDLLSSDIKDKLKQMSKGHGADSAEHRPISAPSPKTAPVDDGALFAQAMAGVRLLKHEKSITPVRTPKKGADHHAITPSRRPRR